MARRKKLLAPSAAELSELEAGFAAKPAAAAAGLMPPIAQVAGEAAALTPTVTPDMRAEAAKDKSDAERLRAAEAEGLIMTDLPTSMIVAEELTRDRMVEDVEAMEELKSSLRISGLRLPVEVFELSEPDPAGARFGLLSGFRRLAAVKALEAEDPVKWATIRAIVREPGSVAGAYLAMVEENEIRADLTPYERGRVAVLAVGQGAFESVEQAVTGLFHAASKAKRSKIRSFALVHEDLGDMLTFPETLSERAGLRLAGALRAGFAAKLREALATGQGVDPDSEWGLLEPWCEAAEEATRDPSRGGRPSRRGANAATQHSGPGVYNLGNGITLRRESDSKGYYIRVQGKQVDLDMVDTVMFEIRRLLEPG